MTVTIWHNPRCSKSRATLGILETRGIAPEVITYLDTPPSADELDHVLSLLGRSPREMMRKGEAPFTESGLDDLSLTREQLIAAMVANPILIERPIVIANGKARVGRPPESVLEIL